MFDLEKLILYLPYNLKWAYLGDETDDYGNELTMISLSENWIVLQTEFNTQTIQNLNNIKLFRPILKPISTLKNDDKFWNEFFNEFGGGYLSISHFKRDWLSNINHDPLQLGYRELLILCKYHYNIFEKYL